MSRQLALTTYPFSRWGMQQVLIISLRMPERKLQKTWLSVWIAHIRKQQRTIETPSFVLLRPGDPGFGSMLPIL